MTVTQAWRFFHARDHALHSPLSRQPLVWERRMNAPVCTYERPCTTVPGPCGGCGYTVIFDPEGFALMLRYLEANNRFDGKTVVAARVKVRGPVAAARFQARWSRSFATEYRAADVELTELHVLERDVDAAPGLAARYGIPVLTLENLKK